QPKETSGVFVVVAPSTVIVCVLSEFADILGQLIVAVAEYIFFITAPEPTLKPRIESNSPFSLIDTASTPPSVSNFAIRVGALTSTPLTCSLAPRGQNGTSLDLYKSRL